MPTTLPPSRTLAVLFEVESRGKLWELEYTSFGLSAWAHLRWLIALRLGDALYGSNLVETRWTGPRSPRAAAAYVANALRRHPRWTARGEAPIVIAGSGVGNYWQDGAYVNRLTDYFADTFPAQTLILEDSDDGVFRTPRRFPRVASHDGLLVEAAAAARLRALPARDRARIDDIISRLTELLGDHLDAGAFAFLRAQLVKYARRAPAWHRAYHALFRRQRPRLLLVEDACYGARSHLIRWAREAGIATAEYQHGYVGSNHEAYSYHPDLLASRYRDELPDAFLTYGPHWGAQLRITSELVDVGNPHLTEMTRTVTRRSTARTALFVSGALDTAYYRQVLPELAASLARAGARLVFRPHPQERAVVDAKYGDLFARHGITVDPESFAYQSVADADLVIGDASTLLFEAAALDRPVAVLDYVQSRKAIPEGLFPFVADPSTIARHLEPGSAADARDRAAALWTPGWRDNYRRFVERYL